MPVDATELGSFLQARRAARSPEAAGLPGGGRRRTPGLRREELAALAGLSIDYLTRLEQGRHPEPSADVLAGLATALDLGPDLRRHLFGLAGRRDPGTVRAARRTVPAALERLVVRMEPSPAWIVNRRRDILCWNRATDALFGDLAALPDEERNLLHLTFRSPVTRALWVDWPLVAQDTVAQLRAAIDGSEPSREVDAMVATLGEASAEFAALWARHDVSRACSPLRAVSHAAAGDLVFETILLDADDGDLQVVALDPADDDSRERWGAHAVRFASGARRLRSV